MENRIAVRGYVERRKIRKDYTREGQKEDILKKHSRILVFDTETTSDEYQNLKFGSFLIVENGREITRGILYSENLNDNEKGILLRYCKNKEIPTYTRKEFVENVFFPEIMGLRTLCVGFNLAFDISRLATEFSSARRSHKGWFSLILSDNKVIPRIRIKHIDSTKRFIELARTKVFRGSHNNFKGYFLDLKTLSSILSDKKHINLLEAGKFFNCQTIKKEVETHGILNKEYIEYNLNDLEATYNLYEEIIEHLKIYTIDIPITKIFSNASLGKSALQQLGIQPLSKVNHDLNGRIKGKLMTSYFGGRCEVKLRKTPVEVSTLDFTSMYPSLTILMDLWDFIIAKRIDEIDVTNEIIELLVNIKLLGLTDKEIWKKFNVLVELVPDNDILPIRSNYLEGSNLYNVGIPQIKHEDTFVYALPDVVASVLLTGKVPKIKKATRFVPIGKQDTLKKTSILGIEIDPTKENFIKLIIEKRQEYKEKRDKCEKESKEYWYYDGIQRALKILANSVTYGIFIELNSQEKESDIGVYGNDRFFTRQKYEEEGRFFNPLVAVMQVSGARLLLATAEKYLLDKNSNHIYMDTDSCFVPSNFAKEIRDLFNPLNPYSFKSDFFKIEKENLLFYGISSKRYVLYRLNRGEIEIIDYKLHGLGHLLNPFGKNRDWQKELWLDILKLHYNQITQLEIIEKYSNFYPLSQLTASTPILCKRFEQFNKNNPFSKQIKPFNFILVGYGENKDIKPITAFTKENQSVIYSPFIDYKSGKVRQGIHYWKNFSDLIFRYLDHPESKFENGRESGLMKRRKIVGGEIMHIGKEANNIEEQPLELAKSQEYVNEDELKKRILKMTPKEARESGVSRPTLWKIKRKINIGRKIRLRTRSVKALLTLR